MSGLLSRIERKVMQVYLRSGDMIAKDNVKIDLQGGPSCANRLVIDLDEYQRSLTDEEAPHIKGRRRRADLLLISDNYRGRQWVVPIELKEGAAKVSDIKGQLSSDSRTAQNLVGCNEKVTFVPMLVSGPLHKAVRNRLKNGNVRINYCGNKYRIRLLS